MKLNKEQKRMLSGICGHLAEALIVSAFLIPAFTSFSQLFQAIKILLVGVAFLVFSLYLLQ